LTAEVNRKPDDQIELGRRLLDLRLAHKCDKPLKQIP